MNHDPEFAPDPRIAGDSHAVAELPLCHVRLIDDARYPWLVLLPRRAGLVEFTDLDAPDRAALMEEAVRAAEALKSAFPCDKLNIAALGNVVAQLHVHVIARTRDDAAWPGPIWNTGPAQRREAAARESLIGRLRAALG